MPALGRKSGEFHARGARTDDEHALLFHEGLQATLGFTARQRVAGAAEAQTLDGAAVDAVVQSDTGADRVGEVAAHLVHEVAVGDVRTHHADDVGLALFDDLRRLFGRRHTAHVDDGEMCSLLCLTTEVGPVAFGVCAELDVRRDTPVVSDVEGEVIDRAVLGELLEQVAAVVDVVTTVEQFVDAQTQPQCHVARLVGTNRVDDILQELAPTFFVATVFIGALVGFR